jgi:DNA replication protein DnaC
MEHLPPKIMTEVRTLTTPEGVQHPSYLDSWIVWRNVWTEHSPEELAHYKKIKIDPPPNLNKLYRVMGRNKNISENDFVHAFRNHMGLGEGYSCPLCSGYMIVDDEEFGLMWCFCYMVQWYNRWVNNLQKHRSPHRTDWIRTFENFEIDKRRADWEGLVNARNAAIEYANNPGSHWLLISGGKGTGKTHLLEAIRHHIGGVCLYKAAQDLGKTIFGSLGDRTFEESIAILENVPVLLIDDYGAQNKNEFLDNTLSRIINYRYMKHDELTTVVATNLPPDSLHTASSDSGRMASRLMEARSTKIIRIKSTDFRLMV